MVVREFIKWAGWTMTDYLTTPFDVVDEWMATWQAELEHTKNNQPTD
jgi:hypothetical protein